jgi:hypothetical protein
MGAGEMSGRWAHSRTQRRLAAFVFRKTRGEEPCKNFALLFASKQIKRPIKKISV